MERGAGFVFLIVSIIWVFGGAAAGQLVHDDFNDGDADGWTEFDGTFAVVGGVYNIGASGFCNDARAVIGQTSWSDLVIETDFQFTEGSTHASILFRIQEIASGCDAGQYYQFHIFPGSVGICRMNYSGGNCQVLHTETASVAADMWHHAILVLEGSEVNAYIDGQAVLSYGGLTHYATGMVGLKNINSGLNLYDNFEVYEGSVPASGRHWGAMKAIYR